jgi:hypothetical protein
MVVVQTADLTARIAAIPARGACTDAERRAAVDMVETMRAHGHDARLETHWVLPRWALPVALGALLAAAGSLLSVSAPPAGLIAAAVGSAMLAAEAAGRATPLSRRHATQNVVCGPEWEGLTVVLAAPYDAPRRGLVLNDRWRALGRPLGNVRAWLAGCALVVVGASALRLQDIDAVWVGAVQLVPTIALIAALAAALDIALSEFSPGAGNAAAAAVAVAAYDELAHEVPAGLAPALVLYGAGSSGPGTLRAALRGADPRRTVVLDLGPCAGGAPAWASRHPQLRGAAERAAAALGLEPPARRPRRARGTARVPALRIACLDERGIAPRSHQPDDTLELVDPAAAEAALDLCLGTADALAADLADAPPAAVREERVSG